ncbi:hypothetical protein FBY13_11934 [Pantoea sp. SJZ147]|nr:hypothetical protein FBY13_11934 [Pantoea sp. SJZ147]
MKKIKHSKVIRRVMRNQFYTMARESLALYGNHRHARWLMRQARSYF